MARGALGARALVSPDLVTTTSNPPAPCGHRLSQGCSRPLFAPRFTATELGAGYAQCLKTVIPVSMPSEERYYSPIDESGKKYYYGVWGNIHYGYVGMAAGFTEDELLDRAGLEQAGSSLIYALQHADPSFLPSRRANVAGLRAWDSAKDQVGIQVGIDLWKQYGLAVRPQDLAEAVRRAHGLTTRPASGFPAEEYR